MLGILVSIYTEGDKAVYDYKKIGAQRRNERFHLKMKELEINLGLKTS